MSRKRNYNVSGLSVKQILNMDNSTFNALNEKQLREVLGRLVSAGNKRLRDFERKGEKSPAYNYIMGKKGRGYFTTKVSGETGRERLNALRAEFARAKDFFNAQTSTVKSWLPVKNKIIEKLNKKGVQLNEKDFYNVFDIYQELKEWDSSITEKALKYTLLQELATVSRDWKKTGKQIAEEQGLLIDDLSNDEIKDLIVGNMKEKLSSIYEEQQRNKFSKDNTVSDFF